MKVLQIFEISQNGSNNIFYAVESNNNKEALQKLIKLIDFDFDSNWNINPFKTPIILLEEPEKGEVIDYAQLFNLYLTDMGTDKLQLIKTVKEITGLGLKESKELCDKATPATPEPLKSNLSLQELNKVIMELTKTTASYQIYPI